MVDVDTRILEITPGVLMRAGECSDAELMAALLTHAASDAPQDIWQAQTAVLTEVLEAKLLPTATERAAQWPEPLMTAMAVLPEDVQREAVRRLRLGGLKFPAGEGWPT